MLLCRGHFAWQLQEFVCLGSTFSWQSAILLKHPLNIAKTYCNSEVECLVNMSFLKEGLQKKTSFLSFKALFLKEGLQKCFFFPHISVWGSCFLAPTRHSAVPPSPPLSSARLLSSMISSSHHLIIISLSHHLIIISSSHQHHITSHHLISSSHLIISSSHQHHITSHIHRHTHLPSSVPSSVSVAGAVFRASRKGCGAPGRRWPAAPVCVAGAVLRASRKGCGAPGRRGSCLCGRRSTQSLVAAGPRLLSVWQAQCSEPLQRVAARLVAAEPLSERVAVAAGPRLLSVWQARYSEVAACLVPLDPRLLSARQAQYSVLRASRKGCGAPGRRWPVCVTPPGRRWPAAPVCVCVWQAQYSELRRAWSPLARGSCLCGRRSALCSGWLCQKIIFFYFVLFSGYFVFFVFFSS